MVIKRLLLGIAYFGLASSSGSYVVEGVAKDFTPTATTQVEQTKTTPLLQEERQGVTKTDTLKLVDTVLVPKDTCLPKVKYKKVPCDPCPPCDPIHDTVKVEELHHIRVK